MAIVILGGLVTSTLLNLLVVPALYLRFGGRQQRGARGLIVRRRRAPAGLRAPSLARV